MSNTLPEVTATRPERTPIGEVFAERIQLLFEKLDGASARLDEAAERIDEHWMADLDATVEAEHAKVADEIAAKVIEDLAAAPLEIDIPGYHDEPAEADPDTRESIERGLADVEAGRLQPLPWVTAGVDPETYETDDDGRGNEPPLIAFDPAAPERFRSLVEQKKIHIGPALTDAEATARLRAYRTPSPEPRKDDTK